MLLVAQHERQRLAHRTLADLGPPTTRGRTDDLVACRAEFAHAPDQIARLPYLDDLQATFRHAVSRLGWFGRIRVVGNHDPRHAEKCRRARDGAEVVRVADAIKHQDHLAPLRPLADIRRRRHA